MSPRQARSVAVHNRSVGTAADPGQGGDSGALGVRIYLRLFDLDGAEIAVLARDDEAIVALPRIGEEYVTAASYGIPVTGVEHDTTVGTGQHLVAVFLDETVEDPDRFIDLHIESGWVLVRDERQSGDAARR